MTQRAAPRARPAVAWLSALIGLALIALAVVAVRDLAASQGWTSGDPWVSELLGQRGSLVASTTVVSVAVGLGVIGLAVLWTCLRPGRRTHLATTVDDDLWLTPAAVAAVARRVADRSQGVITADASARGRKITVSVVTAHDAAEVRDRVAAAIAQQVTSLTTAKVAVKVTEVAR